MLARTGGHLDGGMKGQVAEEKKRAWRRRLSGRVARQAMRLQYEERVTVLGQQMQERRLVERRKQPRSSMEPGKDSGAQALGGGGHHGDEDNGYYAAV